MAKRALSTLATLARVGMPYFRMQRTKELIELERTLAEPADRRILRGEVIPPEDKIYSVFAPFTRWVREGEAGTPGEIGVPVSVVGDEQQLVLSRRIMWTESDVDLGPGMIEETQKNDPDLEGYSFDKGCWSPWGKAALEAVLKHPAEEAAINNLEQRKLDLMREKSKAGIARVALSILAGNVHRIGVIVRERDRDRLKKSRSRRAA